MSSFYGGGKGIKESSNKKKTNTAQNKEKCETQSINFPGKRIYTSEEIHQVVLWGILRTRRGGGAEGPGGRYASQAL